MKRLRIAIAGDNWFLAEHLIARTGEEVIELVRREQPDLALVDIRLAVEGGGPVKAGRPERRAEPEAHRERGRARLRWAEGSRPPGRAAAHRHSPVATERDNPRTARPANVGRSHRIAAVNVLNYFTTLGERGADTAAELDRQAATFVAALSAIDADVVGLIEFDNNGDGGRGSATSVAGLLSARGPRAPSRRSSGSETASVRFEAYPATSSSKVRTVPAWPARARPMFGGSVIRPRRPGRSR
jgi:hypothetical protein